jgi:hypothetical protein
MKKKLKKCNRCGELKVIWKNHLGSRYCQGCWKLELPKSSHSNKPTTRRRPIPQSSSKRKTQTVLYTAARKIFLSKYPKCQAHLPQVCTQVSTDVHHMKGRVGSLLLDERYWLSVCRGCHYWIEMRPEAAKALGFSISRLQTEDDNN